MRSLAHGRRGNYSVLFGMSCFGLLAFGAMAVDVSLIRLAQSQAQAIADAASSAGLFVLRTSGSTDDAETAAARVVLKNTIVGAAAEVRAVQFGVWEDDAYTPTNAEPNAIKVTVGREIDLPLAQLFGFDVIDIERSATSAARALHIVLVMDITNSWSQANFANARAAAVSFLDTVSPTAGVDDMIGMVVFTGRFGVEHTPMIPLLEALDLGLDAEWSGLRTASKAGFQQVNGNCNVFPFNNSRYSAPGLAYPVNEFGAPSNNANNSTWPPNYFKTSASAPANGPQAPRTTQFEVTTEGGCYPNMWREYADESGTDHTVGVQMAATMFSELVDPSAYRAMVILTDGEPNGTGAHTQRAAVNYTGDAAYVDPRWKPAGSNPPGTIGRVVMGPNRTTAQVIAQTQAITAQTYADQGINTWIVSFVNGGAWMDLVDQGDGYFVNTNSSSALVDIFNDIAESLPVALVE